MRYRIAAKVTGRVIIDKMTSARRGDFTFEFIPNDRSELSEIAISMQVPKSRLRDFRGSIEQEGPDNHLTITIGGNDNIHNLLKTELKVLEAHLAFLTRGSLQRIELEGVIEEQFIPETPEERMLVPAISVSLVEEYPILPFHISGEQLSNFVDLIPLIDSLTSIKAFLHAGMLAFNSLQYIDAFRSFYFVIEGLYAGGKYRKEDILKEFDKSQEFSRIVLEVMEPHILDGRHLTNIMSLLNKKQLQFTSEGIQKLILDTRGSLSHYNNRNRKTGNTPHNHDQFESIALIMIYLATRAVGLQEVKISEELKNKSASEGHGQ